MLSTSNSQGLHPCHTQDCVQHFPKQGASTSRDHGCAQGPHLQVLSACLCFVPLSSSLCLSILADLLQVHSTNNKRLGSNQGSVDGHICSALHHVNAAHLRAAHATYAAAHSKLHICSTGQHAFRILRECTLCLVRSNRSHLLTQPTPGPHQPHLGDVHGAVLGAAHGAEVGRLGGLLCASSNNTWCHCQPQVVSSTARGTQCCAATGCR